MSEEKEKKSKEKFTKMSDEELGEVSGGAKIVVVKGYFTRRVTCPYCGMKMNFPARIFHMLNCSEKIMKDYRYITREVLRSRMIFKSGLLLMA